jgi:hypothetical protein
MYMRLAGCVAGIVGVLGWEAMTAAFHPTLNLKASAASDDPLVALSEGVLAEPTAPAEHREHERTWSLLVPPRRQAPSCSVVAVSCQEPTKDDAGVARVSASPAACPGAGPG